MIDNNENISAFLNYNYKPYDESRTITKLIFCWILNIPFYLIGDNSILWGIVITIFNIIFIVLYIKEKNMLKYHTFLVDGISGICFAFLFNLMAYRFYADLFFENSIVLLFMLISLLMFICISVFWFVMLIKKGKYKSSGAKKKISVIGPIIGIVLSRYLFGNVSFFQDNPMLVVSASLFIFSLIFGAVACKGWLKYFLAKNVNTGDGSLSSDEKD